MIPAAAPLLATKFFCPPPSPNLVPRPRLIELLAADLTQPYGFTRKLTLISAPAGYGKTTLVADWLANIESHPQGECQPASIPLQPFQVAWLSLDEGDNDPVLFLSYFITALRQVGDHIGETALSLLHSPQPSHPDLILATLINDLTALAQPLVLVLDDYHVIHTPSIHQYMTFLLEHIPPQLHLVILTREDPLLPVAQLRARGQLLEIRQEYLRFTFHECAHFLQRVKGLSLSVDEVSALERHTEGWIAGLQLAALSMQGRADPSAFIQAFTGSSRFILDYLIEEVFKRQTPEIQDFLIKTSVLERLSAPLCSTVTGNNLSQELLETLEDNNLFIIPLDQSRTWYRYHRLFAELLRHRLRTSHPELEGELHQRASRWYESQNLAAESIQHALAAQDWPRAGSLIQNAEQDLLMRGEVATVIGWFQALPEAALLSNPKLCFDYCWPLLLTSHYGLAAPLLARLEGAAQEIPAFLGEIYAAQAYLARGLGDHARLVERSQLALERLPESSLNSRSIVAMNLGLAYWHQGKMAEAEQTLAEAMESARATGNHYAALTSLIFLGRVFAVRGQLHQAEQYFENAIQQGKEMPINTLAHMDLATLHYEWNQLEHSQEHLQQAITLCQRMQNDEFLAACWMLTSRLRIAQGDLSGAGDALEQIWALARSGKIPEAMVNRLYSAQVRWLIQKGQSPGEWALKLTDHNDCHPFYRFLGVTRALTLPRAQARAYLERLAQVAQAQDWGYGLVAVRALQASLAPTSEEGVELCCKTLRLAEGSGYIRSFVEAGERIIPLLRLAAGRNVLPEYVERILAAMMENTALATRLPSMTEPLSERELEVLRLIAVGMSNREIADELIISPGTAKTHVHHLCGKLGVRNRTEAAMRAKELGLV